MSRKRIGIFKEADLSQLAKDLIDSYHYDTDFLSELLQNAVDSIRRTGRKKNNRIEVEFNTHQNYFTVIDNGTGMSKDDLARFAMGRTDKSNKSIYQIGEKGVGGSYVLLISDDFAVESVKDGQRVLATCADARESVYSGEEPELIVIEEDSVPSGDSFTRICTRSKEFKSYKNLDELIMDLRTATAVGNTRVLFDLDDLDIDVTAAFVTKDDEGRETKSSSSVYFCFFHPAREYPDEVIWFAGLEKQGVYKKNKLTLPPGTYRDKILAIRDDDLQMMAIFGNENQLSNLNINPSIVLGVKGAPMPVEIRPPSTGYAGYWRNLYILVIRDDVSLDAGRKSIKRRDKIKLNDDLRVFFNKYVVRYAKLFFDPKKPTLPGALEQLKEQAKAKEDLRIPRVPFGKVPTRGEEMAVVAIFHEMIGTGILSGYSTLSESSDAQYDGVMLYTIPVDELGSKARAQFDQDMRKVREKHNKYIQTGFIEFKVDAVEFMRDCDSAKKDPSMVMILVAYELSKGKIRKNWAVEPITEEDRIFDGAKHKLVYQPTKGEIPLILLKDFRQQEPLGKKMKGWTPVEKP